MRFCITCGKTLSILNESNAEFCRNCMPKKDPPQHQPSQSSQPTELAGSKLSVKNGKLILESEEGWLLWSGDAAKAHTLQIITERAGRILNIRKRQK